MTKLLSRDTLGTAFTGLAFGATLSYVGFSSWDEVHAMFTFSSLRLLLTFSTAVLLLAVGWWVIMRVSNPRPSWVDRKIHRGTLLGGVLFGVGWAVSGACPSIALVQLGEGQLAALWTLAGIFVGNWLYSVVHERYFNWSVGSCIDE